MIIFTSLALIVAVMFAVAPNASSNQVVDANALRKSVPTITDVKPFQGGTRILFCSSADGFGECDRESGKVLWRGGFGVSWRSIEPMPEDAVAATAVSGRLVVTDREHVLAAVDIPGVSGLCWDVRRHCLWAIASTNLLSYSFDGKRLAEIGRWDFRVAWQNATGHDVSSDGGGGLFLTTDEALLHFDPETEAFELVRLMRNLRAYSHSHDRGGIFTHHGEGIRRWLVADAHVPSSMADNRAEEIIRSNRTEDSYPSLVDFEDAAEWKVSAEDAVASFRRACDRRMFGKWTGRLAYRGRTNGASRVRFRPPQPIELPDNGFDTFTVWVHGTRFGRGANTDPSTPRPDLRLNLVLSDGSERVYWLSNPDWKGWFPIHLRFPAGDRDALHRKGVRFDGFTLKGPMQADERVLHFDNIAFFKERFEPVNIPLRAKRNLASIKGSVEGLNTGEGRLTFPVCEETILPPPPNGGKTPEPTFIIGEVLGSHPDQLQMSRHRVGKTLIVDFYAPAGAVTGFVAAAASEGRRTGSFSVPFMAFGSSRSQKTMVDVLENRFFRVAQFDWYRSNASAFLWKDRPDGGRACGVGYRPKTDGSYNPVSERLFITLSDSLDDVMPTVPNPPSPWRKEVGSRVWRNHGACFREEDRKLWQAVYDHGMRRMMVTDHETCWRDGGESYTYRVHAAPAKGGDAAMLEYSKFMREKLGFRYGPYNNYAELAPVNGNWTWDMAIRRSDGSPQGAWVRTYATKASMAPYWSERIATELHRTFGFNTAYCDVHTALCPWQRIDFDARVPGAGTIGDVFYNYGEVLLSQRKAWNGPVFSEGGAQAFYAGLADGNYARDPTYDFASEPWLVDFELKRIHPLEIEIGMGTLRHFSPSKDWLERCYHRPSARTVEDAEPLLDRFICAELAFGHAGYLVLDWLWTPAKTYGPAYGGPCAIHLTDNPEGWRIAARSYFMVQAIAARYATANVVEIRYRTSDGRWVDASTAIRTGELAHNQLNVRYDDGTRVVANASHTERLKAMVDGVMIDLPPFGYRAWTADGAVVVESSDRDGHRYDYCASPDYVYFDGRGHDIALHGVSGGGASVVLKRDGKPFERIVFK